MRRRKQNNRAMLDKHRQELTDINEKLVVLEARREELQKLITEEENLEIIAACRENRINVDDLPRILEGFLNGREVPSFMNQTNENEEDATNEA